MRGCSRGLEDVLSGASGCLPSRILCDSRTRAKLQVRPMHKLRGGCRDSGKRFSLIAKQNIKAGDRIAFFVGTIGLVNRGGFRSIQLTKKLFMSRVGHGARIVVGALGSDLVPSEEGEDLQAPETCEGLAWFANNASMDQDQTLTNNATICNGKNSRDPHIKATKNIKCGQEILASYQVRVGDQDKNHVIQQGARGRPSKDPTLLSKHKRAVHAEKRAELLLESGQVKKRKTKGGRGSSNMKFRIKKRPRSER